MTSPELTSPMDHELFLEGATVTQAETGNVVTAPTAKRGRQFRTPEEYKMFKLSDALQKYPPVTKDRRRALTDEMLFLPMVNVMNMKTLAAALVILDMADLSGKPYDQMITPIMFQNLVLEVLPQLVDITHLDNIKLVNKHKASILRYIFHIHTFRIE